MVRNRLIDNAKWIMVLLVVYGHLIESAISDSALIKTIYMSIYSFHMPVFIIISGMLTTVGNGWADVRKAVFRIAVPFIVFTILYELFNILVSGEISGYIRGLQPYWLLWFLFSLFIWKLLLPVFLMSGYPVLLAFIIALLAGYIDSIGSFFGLARTLYFFPFFIVGYKLTPLFLSNERLAKLPKVFYLLLIVLNIYICWWFNDLSVHWLWGDSSYQQLDATQWYAFALRMVIYMVSFVTALAVLMIMPADGLKASEGGSNSLYVYIWHGFFVKALVWLGVIGLAAKATPLVIASVWFAVAMLLTLGLSTNFVASNTQRFLLSPVRRLVSPGNSDVQNPKP